MSRYVSHKHGMTLGSDNIFFVIERNRDENDFDERLPLLPDGTEEFRDGYQAIVSFERVYCDQPNTLNCSIQSPSEQIVWSDRTYEYETIYTPKEGDPITIPRTTRYSVLKSIWVNWLLNNVGAKYDKWDTYTYGNSRNGRTVFFKKRSDALKFVRAIQYQLKGLRYGL